MDDDYTLNDLVASEIRGWLGKRQMSGRQLAEKLKVSQTWMSTRLRGTTEIGLTDLERIARALDVEIGDLLPAPARRDNGGGAVKTPYPAGAAQRVPHQLTSQGLVHVTHDPHPDPSTETDTHIPSQTDHPHRGRRHGPARTQRIYWTNAR